MIAICWKQLPVYTARSIGSFVKASGEDVVVLRVPTTTFPIKGTVEMTGTRVIDVDLDDRRSIREVLGCYPEVIVCGGWRTPCFWRWIRECKRHGCRSIMCTDEPYRGRGWKEFLRMLRFRFCFSRLFDYMFVAGDGGIRKFHGYFGFPRERVVVGLYAGDPKLFYDGEKITERPRKFIYVGRYDENKNVIPMCEAFERAASRCDADWSLEVYGGGPLEDDLKKHNSKRVKINGFIQAEDLGPLYRESRCFVLGSHAEQWGVVVHEACMSGCMLLLSNHVGSRFDFAKPENSEQFDPDSVEDFARGFEAIMRKTESEQIKAQRMSIELGHQFSPQVFAKRLMEMIDDLRK